MIEVSSTKISSVHEGIFHGVAGTLMMDSFNKDFGGGEIICMAGP